MLSILEMLVKFLYNLISLIAVLKMQTHKLKFQSCYFFKFSNFCKILRAPAISLHSDNKFPSCCSKREISLKTYGSTAEMVRKVKLHLHACVWRHTVHRSFLLANYYAMCASASKTRHLEKFKINISTRRTQTKFCTRKRLNTKSILHI
jgi:hypothetical protein